MRVYLDNAATTPLDSRVLDYMLPIMKEQYGNPSSIHHHGRQTKMLVEEARKLIANELNVSIAEIFFTGSATESNNMIIRGAVRDLGVERIITTGAEHDCVLNTIKSLSSTIEVIYLDLDPVGHINYDQLSSLLSQSSKKTLVSLMHANNEIGTMHDLERICQICEDFNSLYHCDAVQSVAKYKIDLSRNKLSFLSASGHKFFGPKGVGFVYVNNANKIGPHIYGGGQERNMRAGTENTYGIAGLGKAFELAISEMQSRKDIINLLRNRFIDGIKSISPDIIRRGDDAGHYYIVNLGFPPSDKSEMLTFNLDIAGISASAGSACSSGMEHATHVLEAINADPLYKSVRFSFSHLNTIEEVDYTLERLSGLI